MTTEREACEAKIPEPTMETLKAWVDSGRPVGGFTGAVLSNDLLEAFRRADLSNRRCIFDIVYWLENWAPRGSYGYAGVLKEWPEVLRTRRAHGEVAG